MSDIEEKVVELLDKLDNLASQYAPDVVDTALSVMTVSAIGELIWGAIGLICTYIAFRVGRSMSCFCKQKHKEEGFWSDWEVGYYLSFTISGFVAVVIAVSSIWTLFDIWNWVAIYNPKLALAHKILAM